MEYRINQIYEKTWQIEEYNEKDHVYMYVLEGEKEAAVIDAGFGTIPLSEIVASITKLPVVVFLTHGHIDHIGAAAQFEQVYMHEADEGVFKLHSEWLLEGGEVEILPTCENMNLFKTPFTYDLGNRMLTVLHVPGHTSGSICIRDEKYKQLYTGDTCCKADVLLNLEFSESLETYNEAMKSLKKDTEDMVTTWPGHHANPVGTEIMDEFLEAAELLLSGKECGEEKNHSHGPAKYFQWKNVGIWY